MGTWGITAAGEFSNAINDCGLYVNGVALGKVVSFCIGLMLTSMA